MAHPTGESKDGALKLDFDRRLMVQFRGSVVTSDAGLLAYRELDDALGLSAMAGEMLADTRTGKNGRIKYAIRLPANQVLQNRVGYLLKRPVGRPPNEVRRYYANFTYQAATGPSRAA
jgi:hypothetical protein